jgi:hypothetical protein
LTVDHLAGDETGSVLAGRRFYGRVGWLEPIKDRLVVAFLDGGPHTGHPRCSCEIISGFVRHLNDNMPDGVRQNLLPNLPRLIGTVSAVHEQARHEYFAWQTIRVFAPAALRAQGFGRFARVLENAQTLGRARCAAEVIQRGIMKKEVGGVPAPARLAAHRAFRAAGAAMWFADQQDDFFKGANSITPFSACALAAAGAVFQAYRAGVVDIWDNASKRWTAHWQSAHHSMPSIPPLRETGPFVYAYLCVDW